MHCKSYHGYILDPEWGSHYHRHDWCGQWEREIPDNSENAYDAEVDYSSVECGDACCWMFEMVGDKALAGRLSEEIMKENRQKNLEQAAASKKAEKH